MQNMRKERLSPQKTGKAIFVASIMIAAALSPFIVEPLLGSSTPIGDHDITFVSHTYNGTVSNWTYNVTSGTSPALSHWIIVLGGCIGFEDIHSVGDNIIGEYTYDQEWVFGYDPTTGLTGLKFDVSYEDGETRTVWFKLYGDYPEGPVQVAVKHGGGNSSGHVTGPVCPFADVVIEKRVWNEGHWDNETRANVGDTVRFNISVHNTGNEPLVDINVTDYLPECLQYAADSATVNGSPQEPLMWERNLSWEISGPLSPCNWIYIEFNATVIPEIELPASPVNMIPNHKWWYTSYFWTELSDIPSGYDVTTGTYPGWCVNTTNTIQEQQYQTTLYSSYDPHLATKCPDAWDEDWDMVNYILNHKQNSSGWGEAQDDVQDAIWYFIGGGGWPSDPDSQAMIQTANASGEGFVPGIGDIMAVICYVDPDTQLSIIEVEVVPNDKINTNTVNVTAVGNYSGETVDDEDTADVDKRLAHIDIDKWASDDNSTWVKNIRIHEGEKAYWKIVVTNDGNETLSNVYVNDSGHSYGPFELGAGDSEIFYLNASYSDDFTNVAHTNGTDPDGDKVSDSDSASVNIIYPDIAVTKIGSPDPAYIGNTITYTYTVTNTGDSTLTNINATDDKLGSVTLNVTTLVPGKWAAGTLIYNVTENDLLGPIENQVNVNGTDPLGQNITNSTSESIGISYTSSLDIIKTATPGTIYSGETVTWNITVENTGDSTLTNINVTDSREGTITATLELDQGEKWYHEYMETLTEDTTNTVLVNGTDTSGRYVTNTSTATVTVTEPRFYELYDPKIAIDVNGAPLMPGDILEYHVRLDNIGTLNVTNQPGNEFEDSIPEYTAYLPGSLIINGVPNDDSLTDGIGYDAAHDMVVWNGVIPTGASLQVVFRVVIDPVPSGTIISNQGVTYYGNETDRTDDPDTPPTDDPTNRTVVNPPSLSISKSDSPDPVQTGDTLTYTITVRNTGGAPATNVRVLENYDANFVYTSASPMPSTGTDRWTLGTIPAGGSKTVTITGTVADNGQSMLMNVARYLSGNAGSGRTTEETRVVYPAVGIRKEGPAVASPGDSLVYTITYFNPSDVPLTNVTVTETYPEHTSFVSAIPAPSSGNNTWRIGTLAPHSSATITITVAVDLPLSDRTALVNYVEITSGEGVSDNASLTTLVESAPVFTVEKSDNPDPVEEGGTLTYTIWVNNTGDMDAHNVSVVDDYDEGYLLVTDAGEGSHGDGVVTWTLATLHAGGSVSFTIVADIYVTGSAPTTIYNTVNVTSQEGISATVTEPTDITAQVVLADQLVITKTASLDMIEPTAELTYTITVINPSDGAATNVVVDDTLPDEVVYLAASISPSSIDNQTLVWHLGDLESGGSVSFTVTVRVRYGTPTDTILTNIAHVTCQEGAEDTARVDTTVVNEPPETWKHFHGEVTNVHFLIHYVMHMIPEDTDITLRTRDHPALGASGVNHTYYRIWRWNNDSKAWDRLFNWREYHGERINLANLGRSYGYSPYGKYEIEFYSIDRAGNREKPKWNDVYVYGEVE